MEFHRVIMGANIAGIYGAQIFRSDDKPKYRRAFAVCCGVLAFGLILAVIRYVDDRLRRRRNKRKEITDSSSEQSKSNIENVPAAPPSDVLPQPVVFASNLTPAVAADPAITKKIF